MYRQATNQEEAYVERCKSIGRLLRKMTVQNVPARMTATFSQLAASFKHVFPND
jgi:hypothetical protein